MNPLEWIKIIYGWLGADHPRVSLVAAIILGAILGGAIWRFAGHLYAQDRQVITAAGPAPTVNSTTGPQSPILPNNSGNVTISNEDHTPSHTPPKDKPK